ncbi:MAG: hypothetical protein ACM3H9_06040 [Rhodospirillaceae bacterium]
MKAVRSLGIAAFCFLAFAGCSNTDDVTDPGAGGVSAERLTTVMGKVREAPLARAVVGAVQRVWSQVVDCPATYDLGDATGTCFRNEGTGYYYYGAAYHYEWFNLANHVVVAEGGSSLELSFDLRVNPIDGNAYEFDVFDSVAGVSGGSGEWSLHGSASPGGYFDVLARTSRGQWTLREGALEWADARPPYITVRVNLDSGVGEVQLADSPFANLAVVGGA